MQRARMATLTARQELAQKQSILKQGTMVQEIKYERTDSYNP